jgi:chorismate synthase
VKGSGGGTSSARETIRRVSAGAIAEKYLKISHDVEIVAFVSSVGATHMFPPTATHPNPAMNPAFLPLVNSITREKVDEFVPVRCPDVAAWRKMAEYIVEFKERGDSIGAQLPV